MFVCVCLRSSNQHNHGRILVWWKSKQDVKTIFNGLTQLGKTKNKKNLYMHAVVYEEKSLWNKAKRIHIVWLWIMTCWCAAACSWSKASKWKMVIKLISKVQFAFFFFILLLFILTLTVCKNIIHIQSHKQHRHYYKYISFIWILFSLCCVLTIVCMLYQVYI